MRKWYKNIHQNISEISKRVLSAGHDAKDSLFKQEYTLDTPTVWSFTTSTKEAWQTILKTCEQAKESIYIEQFLFTPDQVGQQFIELFIKKAKEGVHVKLIVDSVGSFGLGRSLYLDAMQEAGVKIKFFNWMLPFSKNSRTLWYFRNHRRLVIVDRTVMITGGTCIGKRMEDWRETQIKIEGPVVQQAVKVFDQTWKKVYKKHTHSLGTQYKSGIDGFSYITQAPLLHERHIYYRLIDAIRQAQKCVYLTSPYFLPDHRLQRVLVLAAKRGVDVRVLIPATGDHKIVQTGSESYFEYLLNKGVKIFRYTPTMIHAKTTLVDDDWAMVGTMNLDNVSLRYNFESAVITTNPLCVDELREHFINDLNGNNDHYSANLKNYWCGLLGSFCRCFVVSTERINLFSQPLLSF
jgi:cardiolipin synthase